MSVEIECALLTPAHRTPWLAAWLSAQTHQLKRQRFVVLPLGDGADDQVVSPLALEDIRGDLYRYQLCVMAVDSSTLAWARTAMASLRTPLPAPLICLCRELRAEAIGDLLGLGADDFIVVQADAEEIRARSTRCIRTYQHKLRARHLGESSARSSIAESQVAYSAGAARHPVPQTDSTWPERAPAGGKADHSAHEVDDGSFSRAKKRVVDRFECAFLRNALMRHAGNVAGAARASAKHRRAFWALMRKHGINADEYRQGRRARR